VTKLRLTLACWDYDRVRALADGGVTVAEITMTVPGALAGWDELLKKYGTI